MEQVVILGAGLGGLSAGWALVRKQYAVTLLEKASFNGGLAVTKNQDGFHYDLGPHNIHSRSTFILDFLRKNFSGFYEHFPTIKILRDGKCIDYPITGLRVVTSLRWWKIPLACGTFFLSRVGMYCRAPSRDVSFKDWIVNRFGGLIYREYFRDYPQKVWGLPTDQIDRHVAEKRIPITGFLDLVKALFRRKISHDHPEMASQNFYLRDGIGELPQFFEQGVLRLGAKIENNVQVTRILTEPNRVVAVEYQGADGEPVRRACDYLLSTIPLNDLVALVDRVPEEVRRAARGVEYCSSVLLFLKLKKRRPLPSSVLYFTKRAVLFSRVSDGAAYSPTMVPEGKGLLCLEFPCMEGNPTWEMSLGALTQHATEVLSRERLLNADEVEGSFLEKVSHSYPRFRLGYEEDVGRCFGFLGQFENLVSFGRQGGFSYINTDTVMKTAFKVASSVLMAKAAGVSCQQWARGGSL